MIQRQYEDHQRPCSPAARLFRLSAGMEGVLRVIGKVGVNLVPLSQSACPRGHL